MKRSELNKIMKDAVEFIEKMNFNLPPFVYWSSDEWMTKGHEYDEIRDNMLGWDITDFGSGDYSKIGLLMITLRNGKDIINRGGGNLIIQVYNSTEDEEMDRESPVKIMSDGCEYEVAAGSLIKLMPGESISIQPRMYHKFWGEEGKGTILVGEVSKVNDDLVDIRFYDPTGSFPEIGEDVKPLYLFCNENP